MQDCYLGLLALVALAGLISGAMVTLSYVLGPKKVTPYKASPYECGVAPLGNARERFPIKFYLVAILFVLFDIEVILLWPWMTAFRGSDSAFQWFSFIEVLVYMFTWILALVYALRVKALEWDEAVDGIQTELPEKAPSTAVPAAAAGGQ